MTRLPLAAIAGFLCAFTPATASARYGEDLIWKDPGNVRALDLALGAGGQEHIPRPPFRFVEEDLSGTAPKIKVKDAKGADWSVKFGPEAFASAFSTHLVWACGYIVNTEYFIPHGRAVGAHHLKRAAPFVAADGHFTNARFQLRAKHPKFMRDHNWSWINNPFMGTPEYNGLRILMMLLSNWDAKDARDFSDGPAARTADSNVAIFEVSEGHKQHGYWYFVSDWGSTMGKWSSVGGLRDRWNAKGYAGQSPDFIRGVNNGQVLWGFGGTHGSDLTKGIRVTDVAWLLRYLGQVSDAQIQRGLEASGATPEEVKLFGRSLRDRIRQLERVAGER